MPVKSQQKLAAGIAAAVGCVVLAVIILGRGGSQVEELEPVIVAPAGEFVPPAPPQPVADRQSAIPPGEEALEQAGESATEEVAVQPEPPRVEEPDPRDSPAENQPREYHVVDFRAPSHIYQHDLENVERTAGGLALGGDGSGEGMRLGVIESHPIHLDFPSNAIVPLWKGELPENTDIVFEVAMSPDGVDWSDWFMVEPDPHADIQPYYPGGAHNPNYGYTAGNLLDWGVNQWQYTRYRAFLYSETDASPILESIRLFYQDSTLGEGQPVTVVSSAQDNPEGGS